MDGSKLTTMSLLYFDGEYIEIPEYIIRIVKRAQTIVTKETVDNALPTLDSNNKNFLSTFVASEQEPSVVGPDGSIQTVSEYILGIIRAAQKVVQESEDDIRDYDQFIDNTFDAMLNEAGADNNEEPSSVVNDVIDQLIEEVCSSPKLKNIKMPEMNSSEEIVECINESKENGEESTENKSQTDEQTTKIESSNMLASVDADVVEVNVNKTTEDNDLSVSDERTPNEENVVLKEETNVTSSVDQNSEEPKTMDSGEKNVSENGENILNDEEKNEEIVEKEKETNSDDISDEELEKIAGKFVENICNEAKNIILKEQESMTKDVTDTAVDTITKPNGQLEQSTDGPLNHSAKVHPEANPTVANFEDITKSDSLPTEGKRGKEQKYNVSKDKIKSKRRSRSIRNSFRRMFSCFSTKSSQLE